MPRNLARRWKQNLPSSIDTSITNVLSNQRGVYVGFNDHVYRLNHSSGDIQSEYDMKTGLPTEIRLAASQDASVFLIGGYGYVERLDPDSLHKTWSTSLPWCGFQVVSLIIDRKRVFAGSNGHVYRLDVDSGEVQASNSLPGSGDHETRVALLSPFPLC
jgi:outer membrane protein assembly factor BamB